MTYEPDDIQSVDKYNALFTGQQASQSSLPKQSNLQQILENALETRKFEIELYWKRATYFWAFIAAAFAGYFALYSADKILLSEKHEALLILTCIGLVFSFGWFLANRGSKFWQENWEKHVDMLEDQMYGPLFKTTLDNRKFSRFHITQPFQYSVSKINQVLSLFITLVWIFLLCREFSTLFNWQEPFARFNDLIIVIIAVAAIIYLFCGTLGGNKDNNFYFRTSKVIDSKTK